MAKKSLLEEAIAEAKQVREAALRNATKQLEENLTPSIKEMLANKLEEELNLEEDEELEENANSGFKEVKLKEADEDVEDEAPADDDAAEDVPADEDAEDAPADDEEGAEDKAPEEDDEVPADDAAEEDEVADDDTPLKDITLGDLRSIIQDMISAAAVPAPDGDMGADLEAGDVEGIGDETPAGDLAADAAPEDEIPAAGDAVADPESNTEDDDEEEIDISEILKELEDEEKKDVKVCPDCGKEHCICKENKANDVQPENQNGKEHHKEDTSGPSQDSELDELKKENKELKEGLAKCRKVLKDVNLVNSKLLYTVRTLQADGLSESQKVKAIKRLDEAASPEEVKATYRVISENFKNDSKLIRENRNASRASRVAGQSTAPSREMIVESNDMVRRFQQLAGIIKD